MYSSGFSNFKKLSNIFPLKFKSNFLTLNELSNSKLSKDVIFPFKKT